MLLFLLFSNSVNIANFLAYFLLDELFVFELYVVFDIEFAIFFPLLLFILIGLFLLLLS